MKSFLELSQSRYTTKHYDKSKRVSQSQIDTIVEILRNTPSSLNAQPWHFILIDNQKSYQKILPAIADFNYPRFTDSSHTIVFCIKSPLSHEHLDRIIDKEDEDGRYPSEEIKQERRMMLFDSVVNHKGKTQQSLENWELHQLHIAVGALAYATETMGIDSTIIGGFNPEKLDEIMNLEDKGLKSGIMVTLGFRANDDSNATRPKSRLTKKEIFSTWE